MNKRIHELAVESGIFDLHDDFTHLAIKNAWDPDQHDDVEEKFANLIIQECAGMYEAIDNGNQIEGTDNYLKALRIRFGVK
jgi:hypothetical protein